MPRLIFSIPLSPWHELFCVAGARRSLYGNAIVPSEGLWGTRLVWFAGVAFGLIYPKR